MIFYDNNGYQVGTIESRSAIAAGFSNFFSTVYGSYFMTPHPMRDPAFPVGWVT